MLTKRIIPCLDVDKGRVVKGVNFLKLRDAGDPIKLAKFYNDEGADELVFLDITASSDNRKTMIKVAEQVAKHVFIPFTVGGGIRTMTDVRNILLAGAEKISLNTTAVTNPKLISDAANAFGNQAIVVAIDAKRVRSTWHVFIKGGREDTKIDVIKWAKEAEKRGAGEILLTSMDADGTKKGFDLALTRTVTKAVNIPVIASGGAGKKEDFLDVFEKANADAALAASLFHFGTLKIKTLKNYLNKQGIAIRN